MYNTFVCEYCGCEIEFGDDLAIEYYSDFFCDETCLSEYLLEGADYDVVNWDDYKDEEDEDEDEEDETEE